MKLYARRDFEDHEKKQELKEHLDHVDMLSVKLGFKEMKSVQRFLGLFHDFGKASEHSQNYLF